MYLLDTNVLIEAKNRYYAFDIAPGFWAWLDRAHDKALACSIEAVRDELLAGKDELAEWTRQHPDFFRAIDQGTTRHFAPLTTWVGSRSFTQAAIAAFTGNNADYLLVAYAKEHEHVLVTHERPDPKARARILIPDACNGLEVGFADTFTMLRETGARLGLRP
jgi:predicted nucleic acid-binding protein